MSRVEHAAEAERLMRTLQSLHDTSLVAIVLAEAQVHATLAVAGSLEFIAGQFQMSPTGSLPVEVYRP